MYLIERFSRLYAAIADHLGKLYGLMAAAIFVLLGMALPITLTGLEDNVDGLKGYIGFFVAVTAAAAAMYAALAYGVYRFARPWMRAMAVYVGLVLLLTCLAFGFAYQPDAGILDSFVFSNPGALRPGAQSVAVDVIVVLMCIAAAAYVLERWPEWIGNGLSILIIGSFAMSAYSLYSLQERINRKSEEEVAKDGKLFNYSKENRNVLLFFVDGAMSGYIPDILKEDPALAKQFSGFTWYSNVVSTGNRTLNGLPALFGGFDYTVSEINKRSGGSLKDKVSAGYKIYVENFAEKGYDVLYSDPFWFGLARKGDCELFNDLYEKSGQGRCIHSIGKQVADKMAKVRSGDHQELFVGLAKQYLALSLFKVAPRSLKQAVYGKGQWLGMSYAWKKKEDKYLNNYFSLTSLGEFSDTSAKRGTFTFITTELTRAPLFVGSDCIPDRKLTATAEPLKPLLDRYQAGDTVAIYQTAKCALQALGKYMEWFKAAGIYDNTMFAIASDHGWVSRNPLLRDLPEPEQVRYSMFQSFLMFKGVGEAGKPQADLQESKEFISNANVPSMLCESIGGCLDKATGKTIVPPSLADGVLLHETPWQAIGQKSDSYVVEAQYRVRKDVTQLKNWEVIQPRASP